jgi:putative two-component system response regulator
MHDVGKIGVPDGILLKVGQLDEEETAIMRRHPEMGHRILDGSESELLQLAATIALTHHEWWDGSGYPKGLAVETIPLEGRIAAIGDVFDALVSDRVYRKAYSLGEAVEMMGAERGTHFDPELLDVFLDSLEEIVQIRGD